MLAWSEGLSALIVEDKGDFEAVRYGVEQEGGPGHLENLSFPIRPLKDTVALQGRARLMAVIPMEKPGQAKVTECQLWARHFEYANSIIAQERDDEIYFTDEVERIRD